MGKECMCIQRFGDLREDNKEHIAQVDSENNRKSEEDKIYLDYNSVAHRDEFTRDRDRILFSRAFRRLEHKAQVYSHEKGDHFRTRLTHSLEVMQISRSLAINLGLNEKLVEAIALGHDIGHTPFGHQGERTLDDIMSGKDNLTGKIKIMQDFGGFKHNHHSLKILDKLEKKSTDYKGMNLTWQVLEGILKHTKIKESNDFKYLKRCINDYDMLKEYMNEEYKENNIYFSATLEGQVVAIADEIAQRQHDLDDGFRDINLKLSYYEFFNTLLNKIDNIKEKNNESDSICRDIVDRIRENEQNLKSSIQKLKDLLIYEDEYKAKVEYYIKKLKNCLTNTELQCAIDDLENNSSIIYDKKETGTLEKDLNNKKIDKLLLKNMLTRDIIEYFTLDVTLMSMLKIRKFGYKSKKELGNKRTFNKKLIEFSKLGKQINKIIEDYINTQILNSFDVNRFDGKSRYIIRELFKAYYVNPRQMPQYALDRILENIKEVYGGLKLSISIKMSNGEFKDIKDIFFRTTDKDVVNKFINVLKLDLQYDEKEIVYLGDKQIILKKKKDKVKYWDECEIECTGTSIDEKVHKFLGECNYLFMSGICDFIAGMTDNYAKSEFEKLYL